MREDGSVYEGRFHDGVEEGDGVLKGKGFYFAGGFKKKLREGKGKLVVMDKDGIPSYEYEGQWKRDKRDGEGREMWWKVAQNQEAIMYEG